MKTAVTNGIRGRRLCNELPITRVTNQSTRVRQDDDERGTGRVFLRYAIDAHATNYLGGKTSPSTYAGDLHKKTLKCEIRRARPITSSTDGRCERGQGAG